MTRCQLKKKPIEDDKASSSKEPVIIEEKNQEKLKEKEESQASKKGKEVMEEQSQEQRTMVKTYTPSIPYPQSINLMPLSMMRRLSIEEVKSTQMSLELVDRYLVIPEGVIENLLVRVGKFIFPANFVILDLGEEENNSLILGRPFLATTRAIIDVEQGELTLRVNDEKITLNVFQEAHHTVKEKSCMMIEEEDLQWKDKPNEELISSSAKQGMKSGEEKEGKEHVKAEERR
ncbi:uncharacterized protein LOC107620651 [Arachis ipaensis]|uniref:uncharacterized protein LOC107620651 n=1 Tax=Arachis ipaensis TaxID=130454 RepID=UPI0007AF5BDF|nr:uncharacterized protein LOC107620651 [Arachis ipaensis]